MASPARSFHATVVAPTNPLLVTHGLGTLWPLVHVSAGLTVLGYNACTAVAWRALDPNTIEIEFDEIPQVTGWTVDVTCVG